MIERIGGRKVLLGVLLVAIGVGVDALAGLSANLLDLLKFVGVGFFLGNGIEHCASALGSRRKVDAVELPQQPDMMPNLEHLEREIGTVKQQIAATNGALSATLQGVTYITDYIKKNSQSQA